MASSKNKPTTDTATPEFDLSAFLPEGFSADDFKSVGGLRPICQPDLMQQFPVGGYIIGLLDMPKRKDGSDWQALLIELTGATKAKAGVEIVNIEKGKEVLVPLNGNLRNNPELLNAAVDPVNVYIGFLHCKGEVDVGKPSAMWDFEVKIHSKTIKRTGKFLLNQRAPRVEVLPAAPIERGAITDSNGKSAGSMVG